VPDRRGRSGEVHRNRSGHRLGGLQTHGRQLFGALGPGAIALCKFHELQLEERVALILLELADNFGVPDRLGVRLTIPARHKDLAELVGASRPRVTGYIALLEREHMIIREGRQLIIRRDRLESFLAQRHSSANGRDLEETLAS
jgi:hypothetical protein